MIADEIIKRSKNPAKTSPGPAGYDHYDSWKKTLKKEPGTYKPKDGRITFVQQREWNANQTPGMKYPAIDMVSQQYTLKMNSLLPMFPKIAFYTKLTILMFRYDREYLKRLAHHAPISRKVRIGSIWTPRPRERKDSRSWISLARPATILKAHTASRITIEAIKFRTSRSA